MAFQFGHLRSEYMRFDISVFSRVHTNISILTICHQGHPLTARMHCISKQRATQILVSQSSRMMRFSSTNASNSLNLQHKMPERQMMRDQSVSFLVSKLLRWSLAGLLQAGFAACVWQVYERKNVRTAMN